jgi:thiol-disulfide isomerase/thioredoxin
MRKYFVFGALLLMGTFCFSQNVKKVKITELERIIKESKTPLIVNFWGTFCIPCIEEIPYFQTAVKKYEKDSVKLLLVSLDLQEDYAKVGPFAVKRKFTAPVVWLDETNADYFIPKIDTSWSGSIPTTLFVNNKLHYRKLVEDKIPEAKLEKEIMAILGKTD